MVLHLMEHFIAGSTLLTVEALVSLLRRKILFLFDRHNPFKEGNVTFRFLLNEKNVNVHALIEIYLIKGVIHWVSNISIQLFISIL